MGGVINNGVNAGTQVGINISGGRFVQGHNASLSGFVVNNGLNLGTQLGLNQTGGLVLHF